MSRYAIIFALFAASCASVPTLVLGESGHIQLTGTYSDLRFVEEAGDLVGTEVFIVVAGTGYDAAIQFSEGGPGRLEVPRR